MDDDLRAGIEKAACRRGLPPASRRSAWLAMALAPGSTVLSDAPSPAGSPARGGAAPSSPRLASTPSARFASPPGGGSSGSSSSSGSGSSAAASAAEAYYRAALHEVFGNLAPLPGKVFRIPFLGVEPAVLPEEATALLTQPSIAVSAAHDRIICVLAQLHGLRYCPQVPNLALLLLSQLGEAEAFSAVEALLRRSGTAVGAGTALLLTRREEAAFVKTFRTLVKSYFPQLSAHLEALGGPVRAVYTSWFRGFFTGWLPLEDVHRVVDAYLHEGPKVLLRVGLALLKIAKRKLKATRAGGEIDRVFRRWVARAVVRRAAAAAGGAPPGNVAPHLAAALLSPAADDPLLPEEYSWPLLAAAAYDGVTGLSRDTIDKLMERYLAGGAAAGPADELQQPAAAPRAPPPPPPPRPAAAPLGATETGVVYEALDAGEDDTPAGAPPPPGAWHNSKIVGIGCRFMSDDFSACPAPALLARMREAGRRLRGALYLPVGAGGRPAWGADVDAGDEADEARDAPLRAASGWLAGAHALLTGAPRPATAVAAVAASALAAAAAPPPAAAVPAVAFSVASSAHLASLATLLPPVVTAYNWACVFSSDVDGSSLEHLYALTSGLAPLLIVVQAQVRGGGGGGGGAEGGGDGGGGAAATAGAAGAAASTASRLATVMSSRRPVFGFYTSQGLRPAEPAGDLPPPAGGAYGGRSDFFFQLYPELNIFPVSNAEVELPAAAGGGAAAAATYAPAAATRDVAGAGHRTQLRRDSFLTCLRSQLCLGALPGADGRLGGGGHALRLSADLAAASASATLLGDLSVPLTDAQQAAGDVPLDVLAIEAFCFVDRGGAFLEAPDARASRDLVRAKTALLQRIGAFFAAAGGAQ